MKTNIYYKEVEFEVEYDYQPEEKPTRDYPGAHEEVEITSVKHCGVEFYDIVAHDIQAIEDLVFKKIEEDKEAWMDAKFGV